MPGQRIGTTPGWAAGGDARTARARRRPALSWSADPGSGDIMLDGVTPHAGAAASSGHLLEVVGVAGRRVGLLAERAQGVVAAAGQLAGHAQGGAVAAQPLLDLGVVGMVGGGGAGGAGGRFEQRPAQHRRALAGQVPGSALAVGCVDGDVQAGVAHRMPRRGEATHLATAVTGPIPYRASSARQPGWRRAKPTSSPRSRSSSPSRWSRVRNATVTCWEAAGDRPLPRSSRARRSGASRLRWAGTP